MGEVSWSKDTPPFLSWRLCLSWGHLVNVWVQRPSTLAQFRITLKGHPSSKALCVINADPYYDSIVVQILPLATLASLTSFSFLFLRFPIPAP